MKLLIACPSYNRPALIMKHAMSWLPKCNYDWKIFVEPKQLKYYSQYIDKDNIITTKDNCYKSGQLNYAKNYAIENNYDLVFIVDDDTCFLKKGLKKANCEISINQHLIDVVEKFKKEPNLGIVSIGTFPQHNFLKKGKEFSSRNKPTYYSMVTRTELICFPEDVTHFIDVYLQLISFEKGFFTLTYNSIYKSSPDNCYDLQGGYQSFDRAELAKLNISTIQKYFPNVKIKQVTKNPIIDIDVSWYKDNFQERSL